MQSRATDPIFVLYLVVANEIGYPFTLHEGDQTEFTAYFETVWKTLLANLDQIFGNLQLLLGGLSSQGPTCAYKGRKSSEMSLRLNVKMFIITN